MNFQKNLLIILILAVGIYGIFLFLSDYSLINEKLSSFQTNYLPLIFGIVSISLLPLILRWIILLKINKIDIPLKTSILIWLSGSAMSITPGQIGQLIKSQMIKNIFNINRSRTAPIIFAEKIYDLIGAILASVMGITILGIENFVVIPLLIFIGILLFFIYNRKLFRYMINKISKRKFFSKYSDNLPEAYDILQNSVTPKIASVCISLSFLYWLIISISAYVVLLAFNITTIDIVQTVAIYTTSVIIGAIMFIPGGLGVTEGSLAGLLSLSGIEFSLSLVIAIVIRLFTLWYPVSIGFVALKLSGGLSINENPEKS